MTCAVEDYAMIAPFWMRLGRSGRDLGETIADRVEIHAGGISLVDTTIAELRQMWSNTLESQLAADGGDRMSDLSPFPRRLSDCHSEQREESPYLSRAAKEADSFATLRNDKQRTGNERRNAEILVRSE